MITAEEWRKTLDETIFQYRARLSGSSQGGLTLEDALLKLEELGLTKGEALRYLTTKRAGR